MELIAIIQDAWGWTGLQAYEVVGENDFGNLMIKDKAGRYWRLCPEDLSCRIVASTREELDRLSADHEFLTDWRMTNLVHRARAQLGPLRPGYKYCLKIPGTLGGEYGGDNLSTSPLGELVASSGHVAHEIHGLPDGAQVRLTVVD
jgi:Domain of unknown function (DUF1851)